MESELNCRGTRPVSAKMLVCQRHPGGKGVWLLLKVHGCLCRGAWAGAKGCWSSFSQAMSRLSQELNANTIFCAACQCGWRVDNQSISFCWKLFASTPSKYVVSSCNRVCSTWMTQGTLQTEFSWCWSKGGIYIFHVLLWVSQNSQCWEPLGFDILMGSSSSLV